MAQNNTETLRICFNSAYDLTKQKQPYSDYPDLIHCNKRMVLKILNLTPMIVQQPNLPI